MSESYKAIGEKHNYLGRCDGRGHRQRSKVLKALNGMASLGLLDEVAREDARRRKQAQRREDVAA